MFIHSLFLGFALSPPCLPKQLNDSNLRTSVYTGRETENFDQRLRPSKQFSSSNESPSFVPLCLRVTFTFLFNYGLLIYIRFVLSHSFVLFVNFQEPHVMQKGKSLNCFCILLCQPGLFLRRLKKIIRNTKFFYTADSFEVIYSLFLTVAPATSDPKSVHLTHISYSFCKTFGSYCVIRYKLFVFL